MITDKYILRSEIPEPILKIDDMFCGCGRPEDVWGLVIKYFKVLQTRRKDHAESHVMQNALQEEMSSGGFYLLLYVFDHLRITEHGGSVGGAWFRPDIPDIDYAGWLEANVPFIPYEEGK